jgi:phage repressor protein C with HTH and peptisase S24 domain
MSSADVTNPVHDKRLRSDTIGYMNTLTPRSNPTVTGFEETPLEFQHEDKDGLGRRLAKLRVKKGITQSELASIFDVSRETIVRWEASKRSPNDLMVAALAKFFSVQDSYLRYGGPGGPQTIQVMGFVGAGTGVLPFDDGPFEQIEAPFGTPPDMIALIVRGDSMMPELSDGDYVLYRATPQNPDNLIGKRCIVELEDGAILVKRLRRGRNVNTFDLDSTNAAILENQTIAWCAKVEAVKYR